MEDSSALPPEPPFKPPMLNYRPMARRLPVGRRMWWTLIVLGVVMAAGVGVLFNPVLDIYEWEGVGWLGVGIYGTPACPFAIVPQGSELRFRFVDDTNTNYSIHAAPYLAIILASQWVFLMPRGSLRLRLTMEGRPLRRTVIAGGLVGMLITVGLVAALLELPVAGPEAKGRSWWMLITVAGDWSVQQFSFVWVGMLVLWGVWSLLFWRYLRSLDRYTALTRMVRALLAGSVLELLVAGPAHAWVMNRSDEMQECYCARGSYTGLVFGLTALFWLFGPGIFLLWVREKRRLERAMEGAP